MSEFQAPGPEEEMGFWMYSLRCATAAGFGGVAAYFVGDLMGLPNALPAALISVALTFGVGFVSNFSMIRRGE